MKIYELKYSNTNTYLIEGSKGRILWDTGWAGTFPAFCREMGELRIPVQKIDYILISHFHPDHMGIAQEIADLGPVITVMDVQKEFLHAADTVYAKEKNMRFLPIRDEKIKVISPDESRSFLARLGIRGEILSTPGHSDDSISLCLDEGDFFVGDLNPLYELELHQGTQIAKSWEKLLECHPKTIYYGHAKTAHLEKKEIQEKAPQDLDLLVTRITKYIDRGLSLEKIAKKTGAEFSFVENVARMYLTHQNISVQGILDRIQSRAGYGR
ncbi:MAG: MBL fold metallo-hydrolase [Firmicutes bacterium]|nr:MBL fold metallo-hydrolase [Bacillota bacterium]